MIGVGAIIQLVATVTLPFVFYFLGRMAQKPHMKWRRLLWAVAVVAALSAVSTSEGVPHSIYDVGA